MGSEGTPKEFERAATDLRPLSHPGVSSLEKFQEREFDLNRLEQLKGWGLSDDEIKLYHDNKDGTERNKMENRILREKLHYIYKKLEAARDSELDEEVKALEDDAEPSTSGNTAGPFHKPTTQENKPTTLYPDRHPMNSIKTMEKDLFDHIKFDEIPPISKRRKVLRRLHRKQEALEYDVSKVGVKNLSMPSGNDNPNSLWDVKEVPKRDREFQRAPDSGSKNERQEDRNSRERVIGPKPQCHYTIRDQKIVRLEPVANREGGGGREEARDYRAVDIVVPVNEAEERLLEGTKLSIDQIRSMERFKHYQPGRPSKVLFLKNISPAAGSDDISILFNQFVHENQAPVHVRLMTGRLRGQAFVHFQHENVAIQALEDVNGTVVKGRPVIAQFGKNSNNLQQDDR